MAQIFLTDEQSEGLRLDAYLADCLQELSRSKIQKLIKNEVVKVNDKGVKPSCILKYGDKVIINEDVSDLFKTIINPENIPLDVVWENENMAVINKPSGMLTHPTTTETTGTLVNALLYKYKDNLSTLNGSMRPGIVHRLDRNTSGLIMIAKNNLAHEYLANEIKERHFVKKYIAVVKGVIDCDELIINTPIGRHPTQPHKMAAGKDAKDARDSITKIEVLKRYNNATLIEATLITGRTHQIRVHLSSIGHPIYNDTLYGFGKMKINTHEQVLQSYKLEFMEPFTYKKISLEIPYDEKVIKILKFLENQK